ncbi:MAG: hypothetical protein ACRCZF_10590 [Gemmataceae bacterium]
MFFPKDWPIDCPPAATPDAAGNVYRIVRGNPVTPADFLSHHELGKLPQADPCLRCGLSVFRDRGDAEYQQKLMPRLGSRIAEALLEANHGKACLTRGQQPTHTTWWPYEGIDRSALFSVVEDQV